MIDPSREANPLLDAIRIRADLRLNLSQLTELKTKLDVFLQSVKLAELEARRVGLREAVIDSTIDGDELHHVTAPQAEANTAFRAMQNDLGAISHQIDTLRIAILKMNNIINLLQEAVSHQRNVST